MLKLKTKQFFPTINLDANTTKRLGGAFIQAKALDKRKKEEGNRVMALAQLFAQNEAYDIAIKAYNFVIAKGPDVYYYSNARNGIA